MQAWHVQDEKFTISAGIIRCAHDPHWGKLKAKIIPCSSPRKVFIFIPSVLMQAWHVQDEKFTISAGIIRCAHDPHWGKLKAKIIPCSSPRKVFIFIPSVLMRAWHVLDENKNPFLTEGGLFWLCGERGIRTPGTVTHTAV